MKKFFFVHLFLLVSVISYAQKIDSSKIGFVAYWYKKDACKFNLKKNHKEFKNNKLIAKDSSNRAFTFQVLDSLEKNYLIKWTFDEVPENFNNLPKIVKDKFINRKFEIIYKTNELGQYIEIINWKEVSKYLNDLMTTLNENSKSKSKVKPIENQKEIENLLSKEIKLFHYFYGVEYPIKKILRFEENIEQPYSSKPLKTNVEMFFEQYDLKEQTCTLIKRSSTNSYSISSLSNEQDLNKLKNDNSQVSLNDYLRIEFYTYPGLLSNFISRRNTLLKKGNDEFKTENTTTFELIKNK